MKRTFSFASPVRGGGILLGLLIFLVVAGVGGYFAYDYFYAAKGKIRAGELIVAEVTRGPFDHVVL